MPIDPCDCYERMATGDSGQKPSGEVSEQQVDLPTRTAVAYNHASAVQCTAGFRSQMHYMVAQTEDSGSNAQRRIVPKVCQPLRSLAGGGGESWFRATKRRPLLVQWETLCSMSTIRTIPIWAAPLI